MQSMAFLDGSVSLARYASRLLDAIRVSLRLAFHTKCDIDIHFFVEDSIAKCALASVIRSTSAR